MEIVLIGLNHKTASVDLRERVAFTPEQAREAAEQLRSRGLLEESLVLSTCNRSELYGVPSESATNSAGAVELFVASFHQISLNDLDNSLYRHRDSQAVRHLFRVSAGLDSMLLGEAEILGQVRDAYQIALDRGETGPVLNRMFQAALEVGKRVRNETELGTRPVSVAFASVKLAERIFGKLNSHRALIVGAGATSEQVVKHLCDRGIKQLRVINRTPEHAVDLAARFNGEVVPWENLPAALEWPDLIVTSVSATDPVLTRAMINKAMSARGNRALLMIDLGVPRNVAPEVAEIYNTYLYNIDDLTEIVEQNKKARVAEIPRAEAIIDEQVDKFLHWQAGVAAGAVLGDLRSKLATEREAFMKDRFAAMPNLSEADRAQVAAMMQEFTERMLITPAEKMRGIPELRRKLQNFEAIRDLFHLDREKP
ncbi:MAG TPA: glutamyl-tRNA reductase [Candidatus Saccharimonadales bacterium]|jgi:glutamyl-tRNA reductase|nr:glutamyl-tRNA reductase [Candidatus Saccharimonadales bacterium]